MPMPTPTPPPFAATAPVGAAKASVRYLDLLSRAAAHVEANLDAALDADLLARQAAMSRHHFHRVFHAYFGLTVGGYVTWRRLRRACELLAARRSAPVLEAAQAVGFESAQALAKAMRRELGTTPTAIRDGGEPAWARFFAQRHIPDGNGALAEADMRPLQPRWVEAPALDALTTTGRGMTQGTMMRAAQQAFGELWPALLTGGLAAQVTHTIATMPEEPQGPEDADCRILVGALFGHSLPDGHGEPAQPQVALGGSLAWWHLPAGPYAVFTHTGPYTGLHTMWKAIYRHWLPATGYATRDVPGFDLYLDDPRNTPEARLRTHLYLPLQ
ncbi:GyrI-like domain-containing protein [Variovorax sp. EL159]|uniref:AraC family transcriptional regulator n=1 Tax=Variovorax sp. EL159 TaxID=1566270 RepID=UPI0008890F40|nr:AraC family transcriptional regulator [Variovorax sp. EL159]SCX70990.1 AraC family transcriptional regulator [Variovorax sp. EL159]